MVRKKIEEEVVECIKEHNLDLHEDCINTLIGYVILGGSIEELLNNPTFEYNDIFREFRELRSSNYKPIAVVYNALV